MFDFIRNFFQYKANSVEEFVKVVKREGCKTVLVKPCSAANGGRNSATVGRIANFQYTLKFTAITPRGRKIVYQEHLFKRFGSDRGFADADERRNAIIKLLLLGEQKIKELRTKLPDVSVDLIGPNSQPMDDATYTKLHQDATACGVSV